MVAQLLSEQATDSLQDRLGDVAVSFKRQQEQDGRKTLKSEEQLWGGAQEAIVLLLLVLPTRSGGCPAPTAQGRCLLNTEQ